MQKNYARIIHKTSDTFSVSLAQFAIGCCCDKSSKKFKLEPSKNVMIQTN